METTNFNDETKKCMDAYEQALEKKIKEICGEMMITKEQKAVKPKELSIKGIKEDLANAFLGDMRIINSFKNQGEIKTKDFIGTNIFGYLDNDNDVRMRTDTYINLDVTRDREDVEEYFEILIQAKVHRDLLGKGIVNKLDDMSSYIEDVVKELYPYCRDYSDKTEGIKGIYAKRNIRFKLTQRDADWYMMDMIKLGETTA